MRRDLIESVLIGGSIALVVLAIHMLTSGAPGSLQLLALVLAGLGLFAVQLALILRRARHTEAPAEDIEPQPGWLRRRANRRNPFFRELTHDWTGLDDHASERSAAAGQQRDGQASDLLDDI